MSINRELDEKREKFWETFDDLDDKNTPIIWHSHVTYRITLPREVLKELPGSIYNPYTIYVDVDNSGVVSLGIHTYWYGKRIEDMDWNEQRDIYDFLHEWEFIELIRIGPEDNEWFATEKLKEIQE